MELAEDAEWIPAYTKIEDEEIRMVSRISEMAQKRIESLKKTQERILQRQVEAARRRKAEVIDTIALLEESGAAMADRKVRAQIAIEKIRARREKEEKYRSTVEDTVRVQNERIGTLGERNTELDGRNRSLQERIESLEEQVRIQNTKLRVAQLETPGPSPPAPSERDASSHHDDRATTPTNHGTTEGTQTELGSSDTSMADSPFTARKRALRESFKKQPVSSLSGQPAEKIISQEVPSTSHTGESRSPCKRFSEELGDIDEEPGAVSPTTPLNHLPSVPVPSTRPQRGNKASRFCCTQ